MKKRNAQYLQRGFVLVDYEYFHRTPSLHVRDDIPVP